MTETTSRTIYKSVAVEVDVTIGDILKSFGDTVLKKECRSRGIALHEDHTPRRQTPNELREEMKDNMDHAVALYQRGQMEDALLALERILPFEMRNLSSDVRRHFMRAA